ncbi:uncharacterized protein LOC106384195 [Brassica napus]|uniref:uncharacterized protein LOC106384195 n=1 Tax=Brassica napus TaxID=3708 RepID=UPI0006AAB165|nr:uncharacterized protein LOC106384195 [Brassica napus]
MALTKCMRSENIMLTMLIPGPTAPSNNIDVYLQPLIEDLHDLWTEGMEVYDLFKKESFALRAMMMWSITDYPGLGTLAGCKLKGKQPCNVCGNGTPHRWLKFSRKHVYMENRKRLRPSHPYRRRKGWFDNTVEVGTAKRIQSGCDIFDSLKDFKNDFGKPLPKKSKRKRIEGGEDDVLSADDCEEDDDLWRWKKKSIFFDLPYWKDMLVRHNIDVMHVKKNVSDALLSILMHSAKSKDGLKARKDLEEMAKCVSLDPPSIGGMKSHDHHVLMQNLLPVALRGLLPKGPRIAVTRICNFFNRLCQHILDPEMLLALETEIVETMCQLERFFPPALFDIMFHLPLHLAREARLGGPVHFRWMYPFERYMKTLKAYVKNFARPEACMAEGYLAVLDPYVQMHLEELQATNAKCARNGTVLWKCHTDRLSNWIKEKIPNNPKKHSQRHRWLAFGPRNVAHTYKGFIINGHRYQTEDVKRKTQNSGVTNEAFSMCRASAKDANQQADMVAYFGVIQEIILLDYHKFESSFVNDPYILPSQAKQVFYSREDDSSPWYVVMREPPRGYHELETGEEVSSAPVTVEHEEDTGDQASDDESFCVRNDCEGVFIYE